MCRLGNAARTLGCAQWLLQADALQGTMQPFMT